MPFSRARITSEYGANIRSTANNGPIVSFVPYRDEVEVTGPPVQGTRVDYYGDDRWLPVDQPGTGFVLSVLTDWAAPEAEDEAPAAPPPATAEMVTLPGPSRLYVAPHPQAPTILDVPGGVPLELLRRSDGWLFVRLPSGPTGYVPEPAPTAPTPLGTATVSLRGKLREQATSQSAELGEYPQGTAVELLARVPDGEEAWSGGGTVWYQVRIGDRQGYMYAAVLTIGAGATDSPGADVAAPAPVSGGTGDRAWLPAGANLRAEANTTSASTPAPGGTQLEILERVQGASVTQDGTTSTDWLHVRVLYATDPAIVGQSYYLWAPLVELGDASARGKSREDLVAMFGEAVVANAAWTNPLTGIGNGGPDFFGPGRYGGQCTWFVNAMRPGVPDTTAGDGSWLAAAKADQTPAQGDVLVDGGHVAYVGAVNGTTLTLWEANWGWTQEITNSRTVTFAYVQGSTYLV